jgi:predicted phage replisome organizer
MADSKKFYWLKLHKDFFKRHDIRIVEAMDNGKDYILFYMKLLLESVDHEGYLRFSDPIPYNEKTLSIITNTNIDIVRGAIEIFRKLDLMEILDDETIFMTQTQLMLGVETEWAKKKREYRNKLELLEEDTRGTKKDNVRQEIEKELDIEIDTDKEIKKDKNTPTKHKYGTNNNVLLTEEEYNKLIEEGLDDYIENLSFYLASKKVSYKSHYMTILSWKRRDDKETVKPKQNGFKTQQQLRDERKAKQFELFAKELEDEQK